MKNEEKHLALYRAYRPREFTDVRGQDHVVDVLKAAIKNKKVGHAYLFAGSRGTGKTSVARIFAREIGCSDKDLYEIDAASNNSVDDIRMLREGVHMMPLESPYKVYIFDEAHMLSKSAWNAFLKTLEEPPSHAVFILATTELEKVPETILSRCETYSFRQPSRVIIAEIVADVARKEGAKLETGAADLIALLAEGSFRDALGILQKVLTISKDKKIDVEEVERVTAAPSARIVYMMAEALAYGARDGALSALRKAVEANMDARLLMKLLMQRVRCVLLLKMAPDVAVLMAHEFSDDEFASLKTLAAAKENRITTDTLRALLAAYETSAYAALPHLPLELALVDLIGERVA